MLNTATPVASAPVETMRLVDAFIIETPFNAGPVMIVDLLRKVNRGNVTSLDRQAENAPGGMGRGGRRRQLVVGGCFP